MAVTTSGSTLPARMIQCAAADMAALATAGFRLGDMANCSDGAAATFLHTLVIAAGVRAWKPISNA